MPKEFFEMLKEHFSGDYIMSYGNGELLEVLGKEGPCPGIEKVREMAKECMGGLEFEVYKAESGVSGKDSIMVRFPSSNHFIAFVPEYFPERGALINIGWRGRPSMTPEERDSYYNLLKEYFS